MYRRLFDNICNSEDILSSSVVKSAGVTTAVDSSGEVTVKLTVLSEPDNLFEKQIWLRRSRYLDQLSSLPYIKQIAFNT